MKLRDPYVHDMRNRYERVPEHEPMQQEKKKKHFHPRILRWLFQINRHLEKLLGNESLDIHFLSACLIDFYFSRRYVTFFFFHTGNLRGDVNLST